MKRFLSIVFAILLVFSLTCASTSCDLLDRITGGISNGDDIDDGGAAGSTSAPTSADISGIPEFSGTAYVIIDENQPKFSQEELGLIGTEKYSELDSLGRCGTAFAIVGKELMPADGEERGSISSVTPSGWVQAEYDIISGKYLYNRCHLIGWQLTAENANEKNLITGTKYLNIEGMLPFENMVADYVKETGNHVAYRITPIFEENNLLCSGVQMEAYSIEDEGEGICFNIYCYNVQPGVNISYVTGASVESGETLPEVTAAVTVAPDVVYRTPNGSKYHFDSDCGGDNSYEVTMDEAIGAGLEACGRCAA